MNIFNLLNVSIIMEKAYHTNLEKSNEKPLAPEPGKREYGEKW